MVDRTDPLSPEAELDALLGRSEPTSAESHAPTSAPNFFEMPEPTAAPAPTPVPAADDSEPPSSQPLIDTAAWVSRLNKTSDEIEKGTSLRDGALGGFGVAAPGAETEAAIGAAEQQLTGPKFGPMDVFSNLPSVKDIAAGILGFGAQPTATTGNPVADIATRAGGATIEGIARNKIETDKRISEAIERAKKNPDFGITTPGVAGATRAAIDAGVQSMADIPASVVDSIGIGANIAGWAVSGGQQPIDQDNSARAVARWARAVSKSYFPSDPTRQEDFAVNLARGIGSTAGFWGVNSAALAARMAKPGAMWVTAAVGALANAPSSYEQAIQSRREGREVSDAVLALAFLGGATLGLTEAAPVAANIPLPPGSKSQVVAYLQAILREGGEEAAQEMVQAIGEDLIAKMHDPNRRIGDEASLNSLIGFLSGGGLTAARLGLSRGARVEAIAQSRYGVDRGEEVVARLSRGGRPGASQPPAAPAPAEPEAPNLPQQAPNLAPAPSARSTTIDLDQYADPGAGAYPAPAAPAPFDAGAQFAPSARIDGEAAAGGGMAAATEPPTFDDLIQHPNFPRDEFNDIDVKAFQDTLESVTGKRFYNQLTPEEKFGVEQAIATGVVPTAAAAGTAPEQTATPATGAAPMNDAETRYINRYRAGDSTLSDDQLREQFRAKTAARGQKQPDALVQQVDAASEDADVLDIARENKGRLPTTKAYDRALAALDNELADQLAVRNGLQAEIADMQPGGERRTKSRAYREARDAAAALQQELDQLTAAREALAQQEAQTGDPGLEEAMARNEAGEPAESWSEPALQAGLDNGMIRIDRDGAPRRAAQPDPEQIAAEQESRIESLMEGQLASLIQDASGEIQAGRLGQQEAVGDAVAIRRLVDSVALLSDDQIKAEFGGVARLARAANRPQLIARAIQGAMARDLRAREDAELSNAARDLIEQSVEDALEGKPVSETLETVMTDQVVEGVADEILNITKHMTLDGYTRVADRIAGVLDEIEPEVVSVVEHANDMPSQFSRARAVAEQAQAMGGRIVNVNVSALANDLAQVPRGAGVEWADRLDTLRQSAGPKKRAYLVERGGQPTLMFPDGTEFRNPPPGSYYDVAAPIAAEASQALLGLIRGVANRIAKKSGVRAPERTIEDIVETAEPSEQVIDISGIKTTDDLSALLKRYGIDTAIYGEGEAKTLDHLLAEITDGESVLKDRNGTLLRVVSVLNINAYATVNGQRMRIYEDRQEFRDGRIRRRGLLSSVSEKVIGNENPQDVVARALAEETGITKFTQAGEIDRSRSERESPSFPGVISRYEVYTTDVEVAAPDVKDEYREEQPDKVNILRWAPVGPTTVKDRPSRENYIDQALVVLRKTSRTASGEIDTSASKGKADQMAEGLTAEGAAKAATENFSNVIGEIYDRVANGTLPTEPAALADYMDDVAIRINEGILKPGQLYRAEDSQKFPYTRVEHFALARRQTAEELLKRLSDPNADPVETAAWIEYRVNLTDHMYADGVGKTSKALAYIPLMKAGLPLPDYSKDKKEMFFAGSLKFQKDMTPEQNDALRRDPTKGGESYLDNVWEHWLRYYRSLMPVAYIRDPEAIREKRQRAIMRSDEWKAATVNPNAVYTDKVEGYGSEAWKATRQYKTSEGTITGYDNGKAFLVRDAVRKIEAEGGSLKTERKVFMLLGMPGAGKSTIARKLMARHGALHLVADDAKVILPEYDNGNNSGGVHEESSDMMKDVIADQRQTGANVIVEKLGSSDGSVVKIINEFKANGYKVVVMDLQVPVSLAMERAVNRWRQTGRAVPASEFDVTALNLPRLLTRLEVEGKADETTSVAFDEARDGWFDVSRGLPASVETEGLWQRAGARPDDGPGRVDAVAGGTVSVGRGRVGQPAASGQDLAEKVAAALEEIGTDTGLFHDLQAKYLKAKRGGLKLAELDRIAQIYTGKTTKSRTKKDAIDAIEAEFNRRANAEDEAAVLAGDVGLLTRDGEQRSNDRRAAQRDQRLREGARALSDGGLSEGLSEDGEGRDAGGALAGDRRGSGAPVSDDGAADQGQGDRVGSTAAGGRADTEEPSAAASQRDRDARHRVRAAAVEAAKQAEAEREERRRKNYQITDDDNLGAGGAKVKVRGNIEAIRIVRQLEEEGRPATAEEKQKLVKYVGWGAFAQDVFTDYKSEWAKERQQLKDLMSVEEYNAAKASTLNAHYTSKDVIDGMWKAMEHFGFEGGRAIEPAAGIGHFIGLTPKNIAARTDWVAVELDKITGAIAKHLYEGSDVRVQGFETAAVPDGFFDLAISNVPFGNFKLEDAKHKGLLIHDYFFAKSLDKVRPGGMVAFITSMGTMDKVDDRVRRLIDAQADLVGAIRLPGGNQGAFKGNAGTDVTTDIIFLRKRVPGEGRNPDAPKWLDLKEIKTPEGKTRINRYFADHPDMMLGKMRLAGTMYRKDSPVLIGPSNNLGERIAEAAFKMPANVIAPRSTTTQDVGAEPEILTDVGVKEGSLFVKGGKVYQNIQGKAVDQKVSGKNLTRLRGLIAMRDIYTDLLNAQITGDREASPALREKLNAAYDAFFAKFGPINKTIVNVQTRKQKDGSVKEIITRRYPNLAGFNDDPDYFKLASIEQYDEETGKSFKKAVFSEDILAAYERPTVAGPADALAVSLNETGGIDMARIADMMGVTEPEAIAELGDRVYRDPNGERYELAELYLSGDVVKKLEDAKAAAETDSQYQRNVTALEAVQPEPLTRVDIRVPFGAPWIPADIYNEFIAKVIGMRGGNVKYETVLSSWRFETPDKLKYSGYLNVAAQDAFGTDRVNVGDIVIAALNNKTITVKDKDSDGNEFVNVDATEQARAKIKLVQETFSGDPQIGVLGWAFESEENAQKLEALYNRTYNRLVPTRYDGSHLTLPGLSETLTLPNGKIVPLDRSPHRVNAIWRAITTGNMLMDHAVGSGKTITAIAAVMEMKRLGMIQRPMFAVPNHMLEQFSREFLEAYPNAKILVADKKNMEAKNRKAFAGRIASEKWDGIIITHDTFGRIGMKEEAYAEFMEQEIKELLDAWISAKTAAGEVVNIDEFNAIGTASEKTKGRSKDPTVKQIERKKKTLETQISKALAKDRKDTGLTFEDLGVDYIVADEAHCFPYETVVETDRGPLPIGRIVDEQLPVRVKSYDHATGQTIWQPVTQFWRHRRSIKKLVVLHTNGHSVTCTANHQVYVEGRGYIDAGKIRQGDVLRTMRSDLRSDAAGRSRSAHKVLLKGMQGLGVSQEGHKELPAMRSDIFVPQFGGGEQRETPVLFKPVRSDVAHGATWAHGEIHERHARGHAGEVGNRHTVRRNDGAPLVTTHEAEQPDALGKCVSQDVAEPVWPHVPFEGWQRHANRAAIDACGSIGGADRVCDLDQVGAWPVSVSSDELQGGFGAATASSCHRGGWQFTSFEEMEISGSAENRDTECARVVRVEVLEQGSLDEPASCRRPDQFVYDIGIEGEHNYFANGILVHNSFKNLTFNTSHANVKGLGVKGSQRAMDLFLKIRHIEKSRPGRSAIFMTGTPMSRSMAEIYTMQRYLQLDKLREYGIDRFDAWASTFGRIVTNTEQGITMKLKDVASFSKFVNVPELQQIYSLVTDSMTAEQLGLPRPDLKGGAPQVVLSEMSEGEVAETERLIAKMEALRGPVKKGADNHLSLFTKTLQIATDMRLYDASAPFNPNGKIAKLVAKVAEIYKRGEYPALAQTIFLDMGVPTSKAPAKKKGKAKVADIGDTDADTDTDADPNAEADAEVEALLAGKFNLYQDIKDRLVAEGIPAGEIAFIHDAKTDTAKGKLFKAVREGKVRVLLGSSSKMGVGTNIQNLLIAQHHVDSPWNPADLVQRDGRILRRGNQNKEVEIYRYITERSADAYRWQILARKAEFEAQFRAGARGLREAEDIDSPIPEASTLKALATGDPRILEHANLTREIRDMEAARRGHERSFLNAQRSLKEANERIAKNEVMAIDYGKDADLVTDISGDNFKIRIDTPTLAGDTKKRKEAGEAIRAHVIEQARYAYSSREWTTLKVGQMSGLEMIVRFRKTSDGLVIEPALKGSAEYRSNAGTKILTSESNPVGLMRAWENVLIGIPGLHKFILNRIEEDKATVSQLEKRATPTPFPRADELVAAKVRHEQLEKELKAAAAKPEEAAEAPADIGDTEEDVLSALLPQSLSDRIRNVVGLGREAVKTDAMLGENDDGTPFVGGKEAAFQRDMRLYRLQQTLLEELNAGRDTGRAAGDSRGADAQGGTAAEGIEAAPASDTGGGQRDALGAAVQEPGFRARAIDAFLSPELRTEAIHARQEAQGWALEGFHGTKSGTFDDPNPFVQGRDFGFHVGVGSPKAANSRLGYPSTFTEKFDAAMSKLFGVHQAVAPDDGAIMPIRMRSQNALRLPDVGVVGGGRWSDPVAMASLMEHRDSQAPESLKRWVRQWVASSGAESPDRNRVITDNHIFSRELAKELERLGYDAIVYKNTMEGYGHDSMLFWDASRIRSAYDFFYDDAAGASGLMASLDYVEQDLADRLATLMAEENMDPNKEAYTFDELAAFDAWHGSPHHFERFSLDKVGTGEGAQAFGWGLYFAGAQATGRFYRDNLAKRGNPFPVVPASFPDTITGNIERIAYGNNALHAGMAIEQGHMYSGKEVMHSDYFGFESDIRDYVRSVDPEIARLFEEEDRYRAIAGSTPPGKRTPESVWDAWRDVSEKIDLRYEELISDGFRDVEWKEPDAEPGALYQVRIDADEERDMLDWDKPLSQQSESVKAAVKKLTGRDVDKGAWKKFHDAIFDALFGEGSTTLPEQPSDPTGAALQDIYGIARDRQSVERLVQLGIKGIRFLDGMSRNNTGKPGTYNYVVFDDSIVEVIAKDGKPVDQAARDMVLSALKPGRQGATPAAALTAGNKRFTPEMATAAPAIRNDLEARLRRMLPSNVAVRFADRLFATNGREQLGRFRPEVRLIEVALAYGEQIGLSYGAHEVVHALRAAGAFTDAEWSALADRARKVVTLEDEATYRDMYGRQARKMGLPEDLARAFVNRRIEEEYVAHLAQQFFSEAKPRFGATIDALLQKIGDILDAIAQAFGAQGFNSPERIFRRMEQGQIAERVEPQRQRAQAPRLPSQIEIDNDVAATKGLWSPASEPTRAFAVSGRRGSVKITDRADGLQNRVYRVTDEDGNMQAVVALAERDPNLFEVVGVRIAEKSRGRGVAIKALKAIEDDLGRPLMQAGIMAADVYEKVAQAMPERVRFHVQGGRAFDGLYLSPRSIDAMDRGAAGAPGDDVAREREIVKRLGAQIADEHFAIERSVDEMAAVRPGLDMSQESRKARAEEMGFDTSRVWYRGDDVEIKAFETHRASKRWTTFSERDVVTQGVMFSPSAEDAKSYGPVVREYYLRPGNMLKDPTQIAPSSKSPASDRDAAAKAWDDVEYILEPEIREIGDGRKVIDTDGGIGTIEVDPDGEWITRAFRDGYMDWSYLDNPEVVSRMRERGYDSVMVAEPNDVSGESIFIIDPTNIRSVNAAFDPAESDSADILSALKPRGMKPRPSHLPSLGDMSKSDVNTEASQSLSDLSTLLLEAIGTEARMGRLNPGLKAAMGRMGAKLYGHYSRATGLIRMAIPGDFVTLVHEGGHALENHHDLGQFVEGIKQAYSAELLPFAGIGQDQLSEGWAEWFRYYMTDPRTAQKKAPTVYGAFRTMLEQNSPELLQALDAIQGGYQQAVASSPAGAVILRTKSAKAEGDGIMREVSEKGLRATVSDRIYGLTRDVTDEKHPLKTAVRFLVNEAMKRGIGGQLTKNQKLWMKAIEDPYKLGRMMEHSRTHATAVLQHGVRRKGRSMPSGPSMQDVLKEAFGGLEKKLWNDERFQQFGAYLVARRMNAEWDRFDAGLLEGAPDHLISRDAWGKAQNDLEQAFPEFKRAARKFDIFMANLLEWKYENGFLTDEQYDELSLRDGYAPLNRIFKNEGPSSLKAKGDNRRKIIYRFRGSTRDFINPIESVIQDVYQTQARVELNDVVKALDKLARNAGPNGGLIAERLPAKDIRVTEMDLTKVHDEMKREAQNILEREARAGTIAKWDVDSILDKLDTLFDQNAAQTLFSAVDTQSKKGERIVYLWENGKRVPILLGSDMLGEDIFNIFASVGKPSDLGIGLEWAVFGTQLFRAGVTKSPAYIAVNWFRDQLATWALSKHFTPFWTGLKGVGQMVKGQDIVKMYQYWAGMMGGIDANLIDQMGRERDALTLRKSGFLAAPSKWQSFLRVMETTEAASRIGHMKQAYDNYIAQGFSEEEAAFEAAYNAHDVMDFSMHGSRMMQASRLVAFLNAQLQGMYAALRTMKGERDDVVTIRDAISPYLKATEGQPLTVVEKAALPNSTAIYLKLVSIGLIGLALALTYRDDPEYEELSKGDMGFTHWFFKINGTWWRVPKPFELAIFSNLFEAMFEKLAKDDDKAVQRFLLSIRETMGFTPEMQAFSAIQTAYQGGRGLLNTITGKPQYGNPKDDLPMRMRGLPPEMQWDAYTSEFSKMLAATFGISAYKTDKVIRDLTASVGRDLLTLSDYVLPRVNMATGGAIPGVEKQPRADKSFEDKIFLSRITRRAARGSYSATHFWQDMNADNGRFVMAAKGYKDMMDSKKQPREAQQFLMSLPDEERAYAILEYHYKEKDQDMHPLNRAKQVIQAINAVRRGLANNNLYVEKTNKRGREAKPILVPPSEQRVLNEILEDIAMREARNSQIVLGKPGWSQAEIMATDGLWKELHAASPEVAEELYWRLTHGRYNTYSFEAVRKVWPEVRQQLLTETPGTSLAGSRSDARIETPRVLPLGP